MTPTGFSVTWSPSTDNVAVKHYNVYRNGAYVATTKGTSYTFNGLPALTTHSIRVMAIDSANNRSAQSAPFSVTTLDGQAPTVPGGLSSSNISRTGFRVTWTASTDNVAVRHYNVYRNGSYVTTVGSSTLNYTFSGLQAGQNYQVRIMAIDAAGNKSAQSAALNVTTSPAGDVVAPTAPTNLASSNVTKTSARVSWKSSTDNVGVTFYNIYRNGTYMATVSGTTTSYNLSGLTAGTTYNITVRALDATKNFTNSTPLSVTTLP